MCQTGEQVRDTHEQRMRSMSLRRMALRRPNGKIFRCEACKALHCSAARTKKKLIKDEDGVMVKVKVEVQSDGEEEET